MPLAWRTLPAVDADWIICSTHAFAHHAKFRGSAADAAKLVYAHTPARYVWVPELDGRGGGLAARAVSGLLKPLDRRRAQEPVAIAANSRFVADRIAATWGRDSTVIHPPVDVSYFRDRPESLTQAEVQLVDDLPADFLLGVSRLVPYKRLDLVLATGQAAGIPVVIAGEGPDEERLRGLAREVDVPVVFVGKTSRPLLAELYRRARAVVFAPIEDFGIIPVEALAAGTPVIANAVGGAAESVIDGVTGAIVHEWSPAELRAAVDRASLASPEKCVARAEEFSTKVFIEKVRQWSAPYTGESA
jgi:glycosyltransferase involved in cell wall biosynthesis